ncbi:uncharacterized protein METZ01_LOCUS205893, partial [marine metagenome]
MFAGLAVMLESEIRIGSKHPLLELIQTVLTIDLLAAIGIGFTGGLMHGFTGWGGAMVMMPLMSLIYGPVQSLGIILIGGMLVSAKLFPWAVKRTDWQEMKPLLGAIVLAIPAGTYLLFQLELSLVIKIIGIIIIMSALLQLSGWSYKGPRGAVPAASAGVACGFINGFSGCGGAPLVLYILSKPVPAEIQRANLIIAVTVISFCVFTFLVIGGGMDGRSLARGVIIAPIQLLGAWIGAGLFHRLPGEVF